MKKDKKLKSYQKRAIENYRSKFDIIQVRLPKGAKNVIKEEKGNIVLSDYLLELVKNDFEKNGKNFEEILKKK